MNKPIALLSTAYLGPIQYYSKLANFTSVQIEYCESYHKQSFRNRTLILSANGVLPLSYPVADGPKAKGLIRDLRITYDHNWQQMHWRGIVSAYNNSPYFEYYSDDLSPFYHQKKWSFLLDFNNEIQEVLLQLLQIKCHLTFTNEFLLPGSDVDDLEDYRYSIHPKPQRQVFDPHFKPEEYTQVFSDKFGFTPNLGILDLLFNEGPDSRDYLLRTHREG